MIGPDTGGSASSNDKPQRQSNKSSRSSSSRSSNSRPNNKAKAQKQPQGAFADALSAALKNK
jgi:hypothetical protein